MVVPVVLVMDVVARVFDEVVLVPGQRKRKAEVYDAQPHAEDDEPDAENEQRSVLGERASRAEERPPGSTGEMHAARSLTTFPRRGDRPAPARRSALISAARAPTSMLRSKNFGFIVLLLGFSACSGDDGPGTPLPESGVRDAGNEDAAVPADAKLDVSAPSPDAAPPSIEPRPDAADSGASAADYPRLLSETGLYSDITTEELGAGVRAFQPRYALWSDGATKRRYVYLPPRGQIDTSEMDFWTYPVGTTAWKEFTRNGVRVETRMLRKKGPATGDWTMIAYRWNSDQRDAVAVPAGSKNANGTPHDIPAHKDCFFCHVKIKDFLLGFTVMMIFV
jgi:hypothetical protein